MKNIKINTMVILFVLMLAELYAYKELYAQSAMTNIDSRNRISLDGEWRVIIDPTGVGDWRQLCTEKKPQKKTDFVEYSFDEGPTLQVPGDFNSQLPELVILQ
jgi:beta-glucuronidase